MTDGNDHDLLVSISAKFESFASEMRDKVNTFVDGHKDHETRLRLLESDNSILHGQLDGIVKFSRVAYGIITLLILALGALGTWLLVK